MALRPEECEVIVGKASETYREECRVAMVNWVSIPPPQGPLPVTVKIRYTAPAVPATVEPDGGEVRVRFAESATGSHARAGRCFLPGRSGFGRWVYYLTLTGLPFRRRLY